MSQVKVAVAGLGNVGQSLVLGSAFYAQQAQRHGPGACRGLITDAVGPYQPGSVEVVAAFDVDERKVGLPLGEAVYAGNVTPQYHTAAVPDGRPVVAAPVLDGIGRSLSASIPRTVAGTFDGVCEELEASGADVLVNLVPVGSTKVTEMYARAAIEVGCGFVNGIPVPLARDEAWAEYFRQAGLPLIGDDCKSQLGATYSHRVLVQAFRDRGIEMRGTCQINCGGNGDFTNMQDEERLTDKRISKLQAIQDVSDADLTGSFIGPAGVVPYLGDTKVAYIDVEGFGFAGNPIQFHSRIEVLDSPNAAGVLYDAVRWCRWAMDQGVAGVLDDVAAFLMKAPPVGMDDALALLSIRSRTIEWSGAPA